LSPCHRVTLLPCHLVTLSSFLLLATTGCVERSLTITSSPSGALVYLNEQEIGHTPVIKRPFVWYGNYEVTLRMDGYETLKTAQDVKPPLFQIVPFDFFAELLPFQYTDDQSFTYTMTPIQQPQTRPMLERAEELRGQLEASQHPATKPAK
jgi:PEGA domain-containing protein